MKRILAAATAGLLVLNACSDASGPSPAQMNPPADDAAALNHALSGVVRITNNNNSGPGSFRQAVLDANGNSAISKIEFARNVGTVALLGQPIVFSGTQALKIDGNRATLNGAGLVAGVAALLNGGANLEIAHLTFRNAPGTGLTVAVPSTASGTLKISLINVSALDNGSHGALINDQAQYFNDPNSTSPDGSNASLDVLVLASRFERNGFTALDQDGLRINEGGTGNLRAVITASRVQANGGDGVEFDGRGVGGIQFSVIGSALDENGGFDEADFDDGIDLDEAGDGSIIGNFLLISANRNFEQGIDLNENDAGDLRVDMALVEAIDNDEEGIEYEEDDDFAGGGDIVATLTGIKTRNNAEVDGDAGLKLREKGDGNLNAKLLGINSSDNVADGILLREDADGRPLSVPPCLTCRTQRLRPARLVLRQMTLQADTGGLQ